VGASVLLVLVVGACAAPAPSSGTGAPQAQEPAPAPTGPKRLTMAVHINPTSILDNRASPLSEFARAGLTTLDDQKLRQPLLAEAVPTIDNGLWKVLPDGRMETTWRIRDGVRWHDSQPFTSDDLVFTVQLGQDPTLTAFSTAEFALIEGVEAPDPRTITVRWKEPFINADQMFSFSRQNNKLPEPRHLLEKPYQESKATFDELPFWTSEYVGLGPFKVREWVPGTQVDFEANPDYVLGRPKIDRVEVKFILDPSTLLANVASGAVDLTGISTVPIELAAPLREQWRDGDVVPYANGWTMMYFQYDHPSPLAIREPQFRRALLSAIDRQQLADELTLGT
jgi:peptide/nickel transport system substrate-binding protein